MTDNHRDEDRPRRLSQEQEYQMGLDRLEDQRHGAEPGEFVERESYIEEPEERESWKSERSAYDDLERRAEEHREDLRRDEADRAHRQRQGAEAEVKAAGQWNAEERQVLGQLQQRAAQFEADKSEFMSAMQRMQANPELATAENRQAMAEVAARLKGEKQLLESAARELPGAIQGKERAAAQTALYQANPELRDEATREALIEWAQTKGVSRTQALSARDPHIIGQAYQQFKAEKAAAAKAKKAADLEHWSMRNWPGPRLNGSPPATVSEARERLKASGSIMDALGALTMQKRSR